MQGEVRGECRHAKYPKASSLASLVGESRTGNPECDRKIVYWHRELPPLDAEPLGEHTVEANSMRVAGSLAPTTRGALMIADAEPRRAFHRTHRTISSIRKGNNSTSASTSRANRACTPIRRWRP